MDGDIVYTSGSPVPTILELVEDGRVAEAKLLVAIFGCEHGHTAYWQCPTCKPVFEKADRRH